MTEEQERLDGIPGVYPNAFAFFDDAANCAAVQTAYEIMQRQYVLRTSDRIAFDTACESLKRLKESLFRNTAWRSYAPEKQSFLSKLQAAKLQVNAATASKPMKKSRDDLEC